MSSSRAASAYLFDLIKDAKPLDKLKQEVDAEEAEQLSLLEKYRALHGDRIQGVSLFEPFNPASDFGKLVIGGKITLSKGSQLEPEHRILIAQAAYLRVELKELIAMKSRKQSSLVKRKAIDEPGVVGWIQTKKRTAQPPTTTSAVACKRSATGTTATAAPASQADRAAQGLQSTLPARNTTMQPHQLSSVFPASIATEEGVVSPSDSAANTASRAPIETPGASIAVPVPNGQDVTRPTAPASEAAKAAERIPEISNLGTQGPLKAVPADPTGMSVCVADSMDIQSSHVTEQSPQIRSNSVTAAGLPRPAVDSMSGSEHLQGHSQPKERQDGEQQRGSSGVTVEKNAGEVEDDDDGMQFYSDIMAAAMF